MEKDLAIPYKINLGKYTGKLLYVPSFDVAEVFVDNMYRRWGRGIWCHLWSPDERMLHGMAKRIGLRREWFQDKRADFKHYDVTKERRARAVAAGAIEITMQDMVRLKNWYKKYGTMDHTIRPYLS